MSPLDVTVAITGLNATDNPAPGLGVARALRDDPRFAGRLVGLAYDALEPAVYVGEVFDDVFLVPYPGQGIDALEARLREVDAQVPLDAVIPTLDSELPLYITLDDVLDELGVGRCLPTADQLELRGKAHLNALARRADIPMPATRVLAEVSELYSLHREMELPFVIKGVLYGAYVCRSVDEAVSAYHRIAAEWGLPVLAQAFVDGEEFDVVAVGDGEGGLIGAVPMRKTLRTDRGKGWAGIAVRDPALLDLTARFMKASRWNGPCEVEIVQGTDGRHQLLEINPRFPAWTYLSAAAGANLPFAVLERALGRAPAPVHDFVAGTMFVRVSVDRIARLADFEEMVTVGELHHRGDDDA